MTEMRRPSPTAELSAEAKAVIERATSIAADLGSLLVEPDHLGIALLDAWPGGAPNARRVTTTAADLLLRLDVGVPTLRATLYRDGAAVFNTGISSGRPGFATAKGKFVVTDKKTHHFSTIYKVEMPYFMRLSCRDFGMHEGVVPGYPASHGCIRLPGDAARRLFKEVPLGTLVTIN